ncbi:MAG TPA: hypothetical protein VGP93_13095 [Polyangiaceae bacterium]|jgi:tetratricopeptide (TPR) repeat protein|nr:hypothetical protein [Polyangiaceae bacterium]
MLGTRLAQAIARGGVLLAIGLFSSSCTKSERYRDSCADLDGGAPVDPVLLAFLSRARAAHHAADLLEQSADLAGAIGELTLLSKGPKPQGQARAEVREVLADTQARLADLYGRMGKLEQAFAAVDEGLSLVEEPTYFRGHLFEVRGLLEERQADSLSKQGNQAAAKAARERALSAVEEAMRIQAHVIEGAAPASSAAPTSIPSR